LREHVRSRHHTLTGPDALVLVNADVHCATPTVSDGSIAELSSVSAQTVARHRPALKGHSPIGPAEEQPIAVAPSRGPTLTSLSHAA
jgi:hypothetical protein